MEHRNLGSAGVKVSQVGLGTDQFGSRVDQATVREIVAAAVDVGISLIDTADNRGGWTIQGSQQLSEQYLGEALHWIRHKVAIGTKGGSPIGPNPNDRGSSRYHLMSTLQGSLRRLRTDHVDLYQIHFFDPGTPTVELMRTLDDMVRSGSEGGIDGRPS